MTSADITAARLADRYVMLRATLGLTGPRASLDPANSMRIAELRAEGVGAPIVLGFGISNAQQFAEVGKFADAVVVGSAIVETIERNHGREAAAVAEFVGKLRAES